MHVVQGLMEDTHPGPMNAYGLKISTRWLMHVLALSGQQVFWSVGKLFPNQVKVWEYQYGNRAMCGTGKGTQDL